MGNEQVKVCASFPGGVGSWCNEKSNTALVNWWEIPLFQKYDLEALCRTGRCGNQILDHPVQVSICFMDPCVLLRGLGLRTRQESVNNFTVEIRSKLATLSDQNQKSLKKANVIG